MKKRIKYGYNERSRYHQSRIGNPNVSDKKQLYSREWIQGYMDEHAEFNYRGVCSELKSRGKKAPRDYKIMLNAYRNGLKAQLEKSKKH